MSTNNNNDNKNNNNHLDEYEKLPEQKKTAKRLVEADDDEDKDDTSFVEDDDLAKLNKLDGEDEEEQAVKNIQKEDTTGTEREMLIHRQQQQQHTSNFSPLGLATGAIAAPLATKPSPLLSSVNEEEGGYFSGRKIVHTGDSDISGSEDSPTATSMNSTSSLNRRKKRKLRTREGKIYELLERQLGAEALKSQAVLGGIKTFTFEWPYELVLVRHGQSEGNEAQARSKRGDLSAYTPEFKKKHSSTYRLTDKGILQAKIAGKWVKENIAEVFDRYYTSEYVRAMETAALLDLPESKWLTEIQLRERDKGKMDNISWTEKNEKFGHELELRKRDSFFWAPPGGESIADICSRVEHTFITLRRECANRRVVIVAHGEIMWAFRVRLERLSQIRFHQLQSSKDPRDQIHNTSILWYTRVHPKTGEIFPYFRFLRSICPWKPEYSAPGWLEFERPVYSNEELLESVRTVPRFVNNVEKDYPQPFH